MTRRLLLAYLTITAFALVIVVVPLGVTFATRERDRLLFDLERDATVVGSRVEDDLETNSTPDLQSVFDVYDVPGARITTGRPMPRRPQRRVSSRMRSVLMAE